MQFEGNFVQLNNIIHFISGPEGNSEFCFPKSLPVITNQPMTIGFIAKMKPRNIAASLLLSYIKKKEA